MNLIKIVILFTRVNKNLETILKNDYSIEDS